MEESVQDRERDEIKGRYWEKDKKKLCRFCSGEIESWEHVKLQGMEREGGELAGSGEFGFK